MNFIQYDLGLLDSGKTVRVNIDKQANVLLLDSSNFSNYKNGRAFKYYGGLVKRSPIQIQVPFQSHWYVAIDLGGGSGTLRSSVDVLN